MNENQEQCHIKKVSKIDFTAIFSTIEFLLGGGGVSETFRSATGSQTDTSKYM